MIRKQNLGYLALSLALLFGTRVAVAQGIDQAALRAAEDGEKAYDSKDYERAQASFGRAYERTRLPTMGVWYARSLAQLGKLVDAATIYEQVLAFDVGASGLSAGSQQLQTQYQTDARQELDALLPRVPVLVFNIEGGGSGGPGPTTDAAGNVAISLDGVEIPATEGSSRRVNPGAHQVQARRGDEVLPLQARLGERVVDGSRIEVREGEQWSILVRLPSGQSAVDSGGSAPSVPLDDEGSPGTGRQAPSTQRLVSYGALGVGAAGLVTWAVAGGVALAKRGELKDSQSCETQDGKLGCYPDEDAARKTYTAAKVVSTVGFYVGLVGAGVGTTLYLTEPRGDQRGLALRLSPGALELHGRF